MGLFSKKEKTKPVNTDRPQTTPVNNPKDVEVEDVNAKDIINGKRKVDFNRISKDTLARMCSELIIEIKKLNNVINKHETETDSANDDLSKQKRELEKTISKVRNLALKLSPTYVKANINASSSSLNIDQILDMIDKDILLERKEHQERIIELESEALRNNQLFKQVREQFKKTVEYDNENSVIVNQAKENAELNASSEEDDVENVAPVVSDENNDAKDDTVAGVQIDEVDEEDGLIPDEIYNEVTDDMTSTEGNRAGIAFVDFTDVKQKCGKLEMEIVRLIGEEGLSLYSDIEERLNDMGSTRSKNESAYNNLKGMNVIECLDGDNILKTMKRKAGVRVVWLSKSVGNTLFIDLFKKKPVRSEKDILIAENDNLVHGYSIKECAEVLGNNGFIDISYDRKNNTIKLDNNKLWIPDIIATDPVSNKRVYFEVEFGNHTDEDFAEKLTKANTKASVLRIITPSVLKKARLIKSVEYWKARRGSTSTTMEISICTFDEMCKKNWGKEYK